MESTLPQVHIILVHGFLGGPDTFGKWRELLRTDPAFQGFEVQVHPYNYFTQVTSTFRFLEKLGKKRKVPAIHTLAEGLRGFVNEKIGSFGGGHVIVLGHSMGGLVARWTILESARNGVENPIDLLVTLATPHSGGELARYAKRFPFVSVQAKELNADGPVIKALKTEWSSSYQLDKVQAMVAFVGDQDGVITAPDSQSDYNTDVCPRDCWETLQATHEEICKPNGLKDTLYVRPRDRMIQWLGDMNTATSSNDVTENPVVTDRVNPASNDSVAESPSASNDTASDSKLFGRWRNAITLCDESGIDFPCLKANGEWLDGSAVIELLKDKVWIDKNYMADFKAAASDCAINQVGALRSLAGAIICFLFEARGVTEIDTADVLAFPDASRGWSAYYLVDSRVDRAIDPVIPSVEKGYDLQSPYAVEVPEANYLRLDPKEEIFQLLNSMEQLRVGQSDWQEHSIDVGQMNEHIGRRRYVDGHILLYGYERDRETMGALKSGHLNELRMVILPDRTSTTDFEKFVISICKATFGKIEEKYPEPNQSSVKIPSGDQQNNSVPNQSTTTNVIASGHGNSITVTSVQVTSENSDLIAILHDILAELRDKPSSETDQLARETKELIEQPDNLQTKAGTLLTKLSQRASEGGKLFDLVGKAQKALDVLSTGIPS